MATFIYSPGVQVLVATEDNGIIDVSEDITQGSVTLTENQPSTVSINMLNHRRKYDGMFAPNDIMVVKLKRLTWVPVFSGYLNQVPYFSIYPKSVRLTATDTLKRLKMAVWDSGSGAAVDLLASAGGVGQVDGGLRDKVIAIMTEVARWPVSKIHIGNIPEDWAKKFEPLRDRLEDTIDFSSDYIGMSGAPSGFNMASNGTATISTTIPGTGAIPSLSGKVGVMPKGTFFDLTRETSSNPDDEWYLAMRWPYQSDVSTRIPSITDDELLQAKQWWKNRKILLINNANNRGVVVRAVEWGPVKTSGKTSMTSKYVLDQLGAKDGDYLGYRFAPEDSRLGVWTSKSSVSANQQKVDDADRKFYGGSGMLEPSSPTYMDSEEGKAWTGWNGLQPHVQAARLFVKDNWHIRGNIGGAVKRNISGTGKVSDHATGHAIDVGITEKGGQVATGRRLGMGNAIAQWFVANPNVFKTKYVIWMDRINSGNGWRPYKHPGGRVSNTLQHRDHVHLSFKSGSHTEAGAMGGSWPGSANSDFNNLIETGNGIPFAPGGSDPSIPSSYTGLVGKDGLPLLNAFNWFPRPNPFSAMLSGPRALLNDQPILPTIQQLCNASQRSFMAAPNGDFIAWFPDYFGIYGTASTMVIRDIELAREGFTIAWDDSKLITHQFVAGSTTGISFLNPGGTIDETNKFRTMGIATVEFPELMEALFNVKSNSPRAKYLRNADSILQRFGARVNYQGINIISGPAAEFWYAVNLFQKAWASQFSSNLNLTFMPELWPGMLVKLDSFKFQAYVEQVTHTWTMTRGGHGSGGGFYTNVRVIAPSTTDSSGFYGLPFAGGEASEEVFGEGGSGGGGTVFL